MSVDDEFAIDDDVDVGVTGITANTIRRADLAYVIDCTSSMDDTERNGIPLLSAIKNCIGELIGFYESEDVTIRLGLTEFRDQQLKDDEKYGRPQLKHHEWGGSKFTSNLDEFKKSLDGLKAEGGGPPKESIYDALVTTAEWGDWADGASRIIVLFTDTLPRKRDIIVKTKEEAMRRLGDAGINQLHLCINDKAHGSEYDAFLHIEEEDSNKEAVEIHDIMHSDIATMIEFLKRVHMGSVYRLNAAMIGSRYGRKTGRGRRSKRRAPPKPKTVGQERTENTDRSRKRYGR
jgi:hypothetical protein